MKQEFKLKIWIGFGVFFLGCILLLATWLHIQVIRLNYSINSLRQKKTGLSRKTDYINQRLSKISSIQKLDKIAKSQYGLIVPKPSQIVVIKEKDEDN